MKIMAQMAVIGALVAGATALNAQTNIDLNVSISVNGVVQTASNTTARGRIGTKDVMQAVQPGASVKARLLLRFSPDGGDPVFVVRDAGVDTVVDSGTLRTVVSGNSVTTSTDRNGVTTVRTAEIREFILSTTTINFDVQGYTTSTADNRGLHRGEIFSSTSVSTASAKVAGNMTDASGDPGVCQGSISLGGRKITEQ